jgi:hypothetical protein
MNATNRNGRKKEGQPLVTGCGSPRGEEASSLFTPVALPDAARCRVYEDGPFPSSGCGLIGNLGTKTILALLSLVLLLGAAGSRKPGPVIVNPSFEVDRLARMPGMARQLTGWKHTGNVGINPLWNNPKTQTGPRQPFFDNGKVPHGRQIALLQNKCTLSQAIPGFEKGKRYIVTYFENGRRQNRPLRNPMMKVTLGGEIIVSEHRIAPVEEDGVHALPFHFVESAVFTAPSSGAFDLVFTTTIDNRVTALIDQVTIAEAPLEKKQ